MMQSPVSLYDINSPVFVTEMMEELYLLVVSAINPGRIICLSGPPGCGKTTTLFWLFYQLESHLTYKPVTARFNLEKKLTLSCDRSQINKDYVMLIDLLSEPVDIPKSEVSVFLESFSSIHKVVVAISSGFTSKLRHSRNQRMFNTIFNSATSFLCSPFTQTTSKLYLQTLRSDITDAEAANVFDLAQGIPRLLTYGSDRNPGEIIVKNTLLEFTSAVAGLGINEHTPSEIKLLLSCYYGSKLCSFGLTVNKASLLTLVLANLVYINGEGSPHCYFMLTPPILEVINHHLWQPYLGRFPNSIITSESAMGDVFQGAITNCLLPSMKIVACPVQGETVGKMLHCEIQFKNLLTHAPMYEDGKKLSMNILYRTDTGFPGIGFVCHHDSTPHKNTLIGIQVTIQKDNVTQKIEKSFEKLPIRLDTSAYDHILLIIVNPYWLKCFDKAIEATSSASPTARKRYQKWLYGELEDCSGVRALLEELRVVHQ